MALHGGLRQMHPGQGTVGQPGQRVDGRLGVLGSSLLLERFAVPLVNSSRCLSRQIDRQTDARGWFESYSAEAAADIQRDVAQWRREPSNAVIAASGRTTMGDVATYNGSLAGERRLIARTQTLIDPVASAPPSPISCSKS